MKNLFLAVAMTSAVSSVAMADGFRCYNDDISVKVFNHVAPAAGTRNAAAMIVSDPNVGAGNKTIATFENTDGVLSSDSLRYAAKVDLRFANSNRKGELILGTKLGQLSSIVLNVDFSYTSPLDHGDLTNGTLYAYKRNGQVSRASVTCQRYLKN